MGSALQVLLALGVVGGTGRCQSSVTYTRRTAAGVQLHVLTANLNDPRVVVLPALAAGGIGRSESFASAVKRLRPKAAVNGTFFSKRSLRPVGDIVVGGKLTHFGGIGTALGISAEGVDFIRLPKSRRVDWTGYQAALAAGPVLVWDGYARTTPGGEGFGDPHVFAHSAPRTAMGITKQNKLLLVTTVGGSSLAKLARAMRELGAVYAVNLDGGSSTAMWYDGRVIRTPRRRLTNFLCVYVKPEPVRTGELRPPRALDWRSPGQRPGPTPMIGFRVDGLRIWAELPRRWEAEQVVKVKAEGELPPGSVVRVELNGKPLSVVGKLPAEVPVRLDGPPRPKHKLWVGLVDESGKTLGSAHRIFESPSL